MTASITVDDLFDDIQSLTANVTAEAVAVLLGTLDGHQVIIAETQPQISRGALGPGEIAVLRDAMAAALKQKRPLVLLLDSAGAKIDEGVSIQGDFRTLISDALAFQANGNGFYCVLGRNVFGGASMLSMCADARLYRPHTRLAMSGPRLLYAANTHKDDVDHTLSVESRAGVDDSGYLIAGDKGEIKQKLSELLRSVPRSHQTKPATIPRSDESAPSTRCTLDTTTEPCIITCKGSDAPTHHDVMSLIKLIEGLPAASHCCIECEWTSHSLALADEACLQSQYLVELAKIIKAKIATGAMITLRILGEISGGLYIALASSCTRVELGTKGQVRTLPSTVVDLIKAGVNDTPPTDQYLIECGVIDAVASSPALKGS